MKRTQRLKAVWNELSNSSYSAALEDALDLTYRISEMKEEIKKLYEELRKKELVVERDIRALRTENENRKDRNA